MSDWPKHRNVKASKNIYKLSDWPKNRDAYASKNILENIKDHLINFLCKVPVRERSLMTSTATWGPGGQAKSD